jgi:hypothetical protein
MNELNHFIYNLFCDGFDIGQITEELMKDSDFEGVDFDTIFFFVEDRLIDIKEEIEADLLC